MTNLTSRIRFIASTAMFALLLAVAPPSPAAAQTGPTAATSEQQLLQHLQHGVIAGQVSIPDKKEGNLIHPAGRTWQGFHTVALKWIGGIAIFGMLGLLAAYYLWHGTMRIEAGRSGRILQRFNTFERFVHWLTAVPFVVLAVTGLNFSFGRSLILPWLGPSAFSAWSHWAKMVHNYTSFAFAVGLVLMFAMWVARNIPSYNDVVWYKNGGGMFGGREPPAEKFNGGEKLIFWVSFLGGALAAVSGGVLLFPFYGTTISNMELAEVVHSVVAVLLISAMFVHFYMGTIGVEGAFEAMVDGNVDVNWAKERHSLWYEEEMQAGKTPGPAMQPAE